YYDGDRFFTIKDGVRKVSICIVPSKYRDELGTPVWTGKSNLGPITKMSTVIYVDSIPAVFGVTRDPFIVFSSNLFAICGNLVTFCLRSLYVLISGSMSELVYLQIYLESTLWMTCIIHFACIHVICDFCFDMHPPGYHVPTEVSLGFVALTLGVGVLLSIGKNQIE
ncbi:hypothetical protein GW17_00001697, partial [Ensete ventricosum]